MAISKRWEGERFRISDEIKTAMREQKNTGCDVVMSVEGAREKYVIPAEGMPYVMSGNVFESAEFEKFLDDMRKP